MNGRRVGDMKSELDRTFSTHYAPDRGRRYTPAQARRLLSILAARAGSHRYARFRPTLLYSGTKAEAITGGAVVAITLGLTLPLAFLVIGVGLDLIFGFLSRVPSIPDIDLLGWTDPALHWLWSVVSGVLLGWHRALVAILPGDGRLLGTDLDWVLAIVLLVLTVRAVLFPLFVRQIRSQKAMQALAPRVKELQARHRGDQQALRDAMMKLYQTEKVNPLMGCLPMFLQIPIFLAVYHVLFRLNPELEGVETTRYGWTEAEFHDASSATVFGVPIVDSYEVNGTIVALIVVGVLVTVGVVLTYMTSYLSLSKTGFATEQSQHYVQRVILYAAPIAAMLAIFVVPLGSVLYAITQQGFSLFQTRWVNRKYPVTAIERVEGPNLAFGLTFVFVFSAVIMVVLPYGSSVLGDWPLFAQSLVVAAAGIAAIYGVREIVASRGGGLGPTRARQFMEDAAARGFLMTRQDTYEFRNRALWVALAAERGVEVPPTPPGTAETARASSTDAAEVVVDTVITP